MNLFTNKQRQYHIASELAYLYKKEIEKSPKTEVEQWVVEMREIHKKVNDLCEIYLQMRKNRFYKQIQLLNHHPIRREN
jgi:hypothetical protein